jgi:hypothetical protein
MEEKFKLATRVNGGRSYGSYLKRLNNLFMKEMLDKILNKL